MTNIPQFDLKFIKQEQHLMLPGVTSIILTQNLYDILFQYVISPEKEEKLKIFIEKLETHIKSKSRAPFSMPLSDLAFLEEGLQELRLLNWLESPVAVFEMQLSEQADEAAMENIDLLLENLFTYKKKENSNQLYVYSSRLTTF